MNFTAIDFETANSSRSSACSLGLVQVREGVITAEHVWLIDPCQRFDGMNIAIHGITPSMVQGQPTFGELWPLLEPLLQGEIVVAHNAAFDMSVLRYCLDATGTSYPDFQYLCTYLLGKKMLQELPSHKLNVISQHFGIPLKHHDALDDARAAAIILLKLMEQDQQFEPLLLADNQGYKAGMMYPGGYTPFKSPPKKAAKKPAKKRELLLPASSGISQTCSAQIPETIHPAVVPSSEPAVAAGNTLTDLVRGQRIDITRNLSTSRLLAIIEWLPAQETIDLDASAFMLRNMDRCEREEEFVFYGNKVDPSGSVHYSKLTSEAAQFIIDFSKLPVEVDVISLTLTLYKGESRLHNLSQIQNPFISIIDPQTSIPFARFPFGKLLNSETAVVIGNLYKYNGHWRFVAVGNGYEGGLSALCANYGLEVTDSGNESAATTENASSISKL